MAKIRFEPAGYEIDVPIGTHVVDLCDDYPDAEVPLSCRSASCGTCRCFVKAGAECLSPADEDEQEVLEVFDDGPNVRLACQAVIRGEGAIVLQVVEPE